MLSPINSLVHSSVLRIWVVVICSIQEKLGVALGFLESCQFSSQLAKAQTTSFHAFSLCLMLSTWIWALSKGWSFFIRTSALFIASCNANKENSNQDSKTVCPFHLNFVIEVRSKCFGKKHCAVQLHDTFIQHSVFFLAGKERLVHGEGREKKRSSAVPSVTNYFIGIHNPLDPLDNFQMTLLEVSASVAASAENKHHCFLFTYV